MRQSQFHRVFRMSLCLMAVLAVTLACTIPFLPVGKPAASPTPGPAGATGQPTIEAQGPNPTLTQAAATLYAPLEATWTASAGGQPAATQAPAGQPAPAAPAQQQPGQPPLMQPQQPTLAPLIQPQQPGQGAQPPQAPPIQPQQPAQGGQPAAREAAQLLPPLPTPTSFWASLANQPGQPQPPAAQPQAGQGGLIQPYQPQQPVQPAQSAPGEVPLIRPVQPGGQGAQPTPGAPLPPAPPPNLPQPSQNFTPFPAAGFDVPAGQGFGVLGVNLPVCGGIYTANFLVHNTGAAPLESASIQITDLSSGGALFGPYSSDAPFGGSDTACTPGGIDSLAPNAGLFVGSSLGAADLSGHTMRVDLRLCAQNGLGGTCYNRIIEFVVP